MSTAPFLSSSAGNSKASVGALLQGGEYNLACTKHTFLPSILLYGRSLSFLFGPNHAMIGEQQARIDQGTALLREKHTTSSHPGPSQATYRDVTFWTALAEATPVQNFWVVAAGSYSSHTVVSSKFMPLTSSPPHRVLPQHQCMNLFDNDCFSLAFTKDHFDQYLAEVDNPCLKFNNVMTRIMDYASPCDPNLQADLDTKLMHPGVVDALARHLLDKVNQQMKSMSHPTEDSLNEGIESFNKILLGHVASPNPSAWHGAPPNHTQLVLPTQWHEVYLKALLQPPELLGKVKDMTINGFLEQTIRKFRSSTLCHCLDRESILHEKVYDMEFLCAAQEVVEHPKGLLHEGVRAKEHAGQFETSGKYTKALPTWEWWIIDFHHTVKPKKDCDSDGYRTISTTQIAGQPFFDFTISGANYKGCCGTLMQ
ncbi:hypothetical protein BT96DRAFT_943345 [Gymnopus androsaceus JB14]|uniref:Uncharacterized protein n=1 Tax=Gymnopus androsaceus JB14 TaxID=1447944 RepID=A0A6A4H8U3_9AGAR|nr:hypothetical protein BT96DRAFT_943345 [Gymnopus androsaceus JB14]